MFDQFTLSGADGTQRGVQVIDANLALGNDQLVSVAWAVRPLSRRGRYLLFVNHTTGTVTFHTEDLGMLALGTRWGFIAASVITMGLAFGIGWNPLWLLVMILCIVAFRVLRRLNVWLFSRSSSQRLVGVLNDIASEPGFSMAPATTPPVVATLAPPVTPAGWLSDPTTRHELRYWDGGHWTEHVVDAGTPAVDPLHSVAGELPPTGANRPA